MAISERPEQELSDEDLDHLFDYHPPTEDQGERHAAINAAAKEFAKAIRLYLATGPERTLAVRALQRLRMDCHLAIQTERRLTELVVDSTRHV